MYAIWSPINSVSGSWPVTFGGLDDVGGWFGGAFGEDSSRVVMLLSCWDDASDSTCKSSWHSSKEAYTARASSLESSAPMRSSVYCSTGRSKLSWLEFLAKQRSRELTFWSISLVAVGVGWEVGLFSSWSRACCRTRAADMHRKFCMPPMALRRVERNCTPRQVSYWNCMPTS